MSVKLKAKVEASIDRELSDADGTRVVVRLGTPSALSGGRVFFECLPVDARLLATDLLEAADAVENTDIVTKPKKP